MLYYVKTDRLFNSMDVEVDPPDGGKFFFDVSGMELKRANEKRELTYTFKSFRDGKTSLTVGYSEKGRKTKVDDILKAVKAKGVTLNEETLEKAFRVFEKQSEVDYFINKNARAFLCEQFDLWMYQYLFKGESVFNETRLQQLQAIREIAYRIIDFIAQFEDELVRVWNKPKFVLNSHYIITVDHVIARNEVTKQSPAKRGKAKGEEIASGDSAPRNDILEKLFNHKGMKDQIAEWIDLGMVDRKFKPEMALERDLVGDPLYPQYQYLPLDTRYFKDLELDILALFDDPSTGSGQGLDAALDGWLIHSENYQALNTILPKFQDRVKAIYIDPPYNTGGDEFLYKDKFRHASWLAMIENRLLPARQLLNSSGMIFVNIDENEQSSLRLLMEEVFEPENYVVPFIWTSRAGKSLTASMFQIAHEHIESAAKDKARIAIKPMRKIIEGGRFKDTKGEYNRELLRQWGGQHDRREDRPNLYYPIPTPFGKDAYPKRPDGSDGNWRCSKENAMKMLKDNDLDFVQDDVTGDITVYRKIRAGQVTFSVPSNMLNDVGTSTDGTKSLLALFGNKIFGTAKPPQLV
ncbi:MAG TPA: site-specific DNA-methyltransferase, partial [Anaerolineales bacterium]|nr:site-specific DNA-methyltransferase [Anaerolineales bacterium]